MNKIITFMTLVSLLMNSCQDRSCKFNDNFVLSESFLYYSDENGYNYCNLFESSFEGDEESIKKLSLLSFFAGAAYEHGVVLIEIIDKFGEDYYLSSIGNLSLEEKRSICGYLKAGCDHTKNQKYRGHYFKSFKTIRQTLTCD